ncbi:MAG: hypothetical protein KKE17_09965 [Proteobacteria bacterium]|nr:hypothetical protein [Pseudomonadota bacterium]MBU1710318.1 hypothetical protein [Pseudomonadota bacterium]
MTQYFEKPGFTNTEETLAILKQGLNQYGIKQVVVASTVGSTGLAAARMFQGTEVKVVVVTHNVGFKEPGVLEMPPETRQEIEAMGAVVHTGTMPFRTIGTAIRAKQEYSQQDLIANTLRLFGQGIKVCVEIAMMASDAGLISPDDVLTVAGTARGADTVALIAPQSSNKLFDLKIKRILAKPSNW